MAVDETTHTYPSFSSEFHSIAIPSLPHDHFCNSSSDQALLGNSISDLRFLIDGDLEFTLEDSVDDHLYFPSENELFFVVPANPEMSPVSGISSEDDDKKTNCVLSTSIGYNRDSDCSGAANCVSDLLESTNDHKFKVEEEAITTSLTKRKKEIEEMRIYKYRRSDEDGAASEDDDEVKNTRLIRNRESALLSRQRKKHYVEELEDKVKIMHSTITDLNSKMSYFMAENVTLRHQVAPRSLMCYPTMYPPLVPMAYPWMPCPTYMMVKPQGSQAALLPIPRLKPQQSLAKVKKINKVASVSVLGLLFCLFLFGALAPIVNITYGEYKFTDQSRGRVLDVSVDSNRARAHCGSDSDQGVGRNVSATENSVHPLNSSEPLVASLFVPRNEKLVKIDGNLIIRSVLACEKAMASETENEEGKSSVGTTTKGIISPALPVPVSTRNVDMSKHLYSEMRETMPSSSSHDALKDRLKSTAANAKIQQWFRVGVAGPMFSSGMCTEECQFDVSSTSRATIPAPPPIQQSANTTDTHKGKQNRRILRGGLPVSNFNLTKDHNSSSKENIRDTKSAPSMVVSVLVDPREGSDGDLDGMMGVTNSLSRVFIVVLVDGVKYVTYSCVLPQPDVPHLVTT